MKILHTVESYYPELGGMSEVVKQLSERLAYLGHEVVVATKKSKNRNASVINGVKIEEFEIDGNLVRGITGEQEKYKDFLLNSNFDIVSNFAAQQWATDICLPILKDIKGKKVSVPTGFSGLFLPEYQNYYNQMKDWMKNYDCNVFLSHNYRDINFAKANGITKNVIIPNGASSEEFLEPQKIDIRKKLNIKNDDFFILHVGSYTGIKGHVEALKMYLLSKIKNGVLLFIGNNNQYFELYTQKSKWFFLWKLEHFFPSKKYIITSLTREETIAAYKAADLFLFPSNIECSPIVLFEAAASKTPFLATDVGNSKEIATWTQAGEILPTVIDEKGNSNAKIKESIKMLNDIYLDSEKRKKLSESGFENWNKNFTWNAITLQYEKLYKSLIKNESE